MDVHFSPANEMPLDFETMFSKMKAALKPRLPKLDDPVPAKYWSEILHWWSRYASAKVVDPDQMTRLLVKMLLMILLVHDHVAAGSTKWQHFVEQFPYLLRVKVPKNTDFPEQNTVVLDLLKKYQKPHTKRSRGQTDGGSGHPEKRSKSEKQPRREKRRLESRVSCKRPAKKQERSSSSGGEEMKDTSAAQTLFAERLRSVRAEELKVHASLERLLFAATNKRANFETVVLVMYRTFMQDEAGFAAWIKDQFKRVGQMMVVKREQLLRPVTQQIYIDALNDVSPVCAEYVQTFFHGLNNPRRDD